MSGKELVIDFSESGEAQAMHMDEFDLGFLGDKVVERATEIKFDAATQTWGLYLPAEGGWAAVETGMGFSSYEVARLHEVAWLNTCRALGIEPGGSRGLSMLTQVRNRVATTVLDVVLPEVRDA